MQAVIVPWIEGSVSPAFYRKRMESIIHVSTIWITILHRQKKHLRDDSHHFIRGNLLEHGSDISFLPRARNQPAAY